MLFILFYILYIFEIEFLCEFYFKYFFLKVIEFVINKKRKEIFEIEFEKIGVFFKFYEV